MLRLIDSHPPLWRTATSVQFGVDAAVVLDDVDHWQHELLDALVGGASRDHLTARARGAGVDPVDASAFIDRLMPVLSAGDPAPVRVRIEGPDSWRFPEQQAFVLGLDSAAIASEPRWREDPLETDPVILVAHRLVDPRRARALMAADVTHLPVHLGGDEVSVGPLIIPGRTACLSCLHAHRTDADPQWPLLAAQLIGRAPVHTDPGLILEAARVAAHLLRAPEAMQGLAVTLRAQDARRQWQRHRAHAECLCRVPEGSATAGADVRTTTQTDSATANRPRA